MRRLVKWLLVLLVLAVIFAAGYWQANKPRPISVTVAFAKPGIVENTVANTRAGTIAACRRAGLSPSTGGLISVLNVSKGDSVKKGDLLLSLWNKDLMAEIELSQAEAASANANASLLLTRSRWYARRSADFLPTPGSFENWSMTLTTDSLSCAMPNCVSSSVHEAKCHVVCGLFALKSGSV